MRSSLRSAISIVSLALFGAASGPSALAAGPVENTLIGVRIGATAASIIKDFGQPTSVETGDNDVFGGSQSAASSGGSGYGSSMSSGMGAAAMPKPPTIMRTPNGKGASTSAISSPSGYPGSGSSSRGSGSSSGLSGLSGSPNPYSRSGSGGSGGPGASSGPGGAAGGLDPELGEGEIKWEYYNPKTKSTRTFLFGKGGKVVQIQTAGFSNGGATSGGIHLGDAQGKIISAYGFTNQVYNSDDVNPITGAPVSVMTMDYSRSSHVAFDLADLHDGKGFRVMRITIGALSQGDL